MWILCLSIIDTPRGNRNRHAAEGVAEMIGTPQNEVTNNRILKNSEIVKTGTVMVKRIFGAKNLVK